MEDRYTVSSIPEPKETRPCEKHGTFEVKYLHIGSNRFWVFPNCTKCVEEENAAKKEMDEAKAKELKAKNKKRHYEDVRLGAGISKRNLHKNFDDYICSNEGQEKAKSDCIRYVNEFPSDKSMIMVGGVGTGKTLLASAMVDALVDKNKCEIIKVIDVVRELKASWSKESKATEEGIIKSFVDLDLLILDEVGSQFGSDTEKLFIFDIIDGRYQEMKQTVLISNLDIDGIKGAIGERCVDRLREGGGMMIAFNWESQRG